jgi:hypothetical protein
MPKTKAQVWTIEFDGHPPVPLRDNEIGTVGWTPPDMPGLPWDVHVPVVFSHYEFTLDSCPPLRRRSGQWPATLRGPDGTDQPGSARVGYSGWTDSKRTVETYSVVFVPHRYPDA